MMQRVVVVVAVLSLAAAQQGDEQNPFYARRGRKICVNDGKHNRNGRNRPTFPTMEECCRESFSRRAQLRRCLRNSPTPVPATPEPATPAPLTPQPATPAPVTPEPATPAPVTPAPATPAPVTPAPATPEPATPAPVTPQPATPAPVTPAPATPEPATPQPATPAPVTPEPTTGAPAGGCPPRVRHAWSTLSCAERQHFVDAVAAFRARDEQGWLEFAESHTQQFSYAHGTSVFLHWHRWYLLALENALREGPGFECVTLPYWDWDTEAGSEMDASVFEAQTFGTTDRSGCVSDGKFAGWVASDGRCLSRRFSGSRFTSSNAMATLIRRTPNYRDFRPAFEAAPHASPHIFIGGHMGSGVSPNDPLFFVHHTNVDRLWAVWQNYHEHHTVAKSDLTSTHYFAAKDGRWNPTQVSDLQLDSVMQFGNPNNGGRTLRYLQGSVTVRDMHSPQHMPRASDNYVYGTDAVAALLGQPRNGGAWTWMTAGQQPAVVTCDASTERHGAVQQKKHDNAQAAKQKAELSAAQNGVRAEAERDGRDSAWVVCELARVECKYVQSHSHYQFSDEQIVKMMMDPSTQRNLFQCTGLLPETC